MKNLAFAGFALLAATPAVAEQPVHSQIAAGATVATATPTNPALAERLRLTRQANRWETAYMALNVIDVAQTCDGLARGIGVESNPLLGKKPSCGKLIAFKAAMSGLHYLVFDHLRDRDPKAARIGAQLSVGIQGAIVGLNMRYTFKGR